jgi:hypothetical protein
MLVGQSINWLRRTIVVRHRWVRKRLDVAVRLTFHVHGRDVDWCIFLPSMLASYDSRLRHAGLMAIAAIGEGTSKVHRSWLFVFGEWGVGMLEYIGYTERVGQGR